MPQEIKVDLLAAARAQGGLGGAAAPQPPRRPAAPPPDPEATGPAAPGADSRVSAPGAAADAPASDPPPKPYEPPAEDVADFIRCVATGGVYTREVRLFDGGVTVKFRDLTADEEDGVANQVVAELSAKLYGTVIDVGMRFTDLRIGWAVASLYVGGAKTHESPFGGPRVAEDADKAHAKLRAACRTSTVYQGVRKAFAVFFNNLWAVQHKTADPSFRSATPGAGPSAAPPSAAG